MPAASWLRRWKNRPIRRTGSAENLKTRCGAFRLRLEALEDRTVPASFDFSLPLPDGGTNPDHILAVPGDSTHLWFTETKNGISQIARINTSAGPLFGQVETFPAPGLRPDSVVADWSGHVWFSASLDSGSTRITEMGVDGSLVKTLDTQSGVESFVPDPSGNAVWLAPYSADGHSGVARLDMAGAPLQFYRVPGGIGDFDVVVTNLAFDQWGTLWYTGFDPRFLSSGGGGVLYPFIGGIYYPIGHSGLSERDGRVVFGSDNSISGNSIWDWSPTANAIAQIVVDGVGFTPPPGGGLSLSIPTPSDVVAGTAGTLWFAEAGDNKVGRVSRDGHVQEYTLPPQIANLSSIAVASDGNMWYVEPNTNTIGRLALSNQLPEAGFDIRDSSGTIVTTVNEGQSYHFDARNTADVESANLICHWQVNGVPVANPGQGLDLIFPDNGPAVVALFVEDPFTGLSAAVSQTITVQSVAPAVNLNVSAGGGLDPNFGIGGVATTDVSATGDVAFAPTQMADGRIVAPIRVGGVVAGFRRFLATGSPDPTFGPNGDGRVTIPSVSAFAAYALQGDKIVLATQSGSTVSLARFNFDGSPDTGFGTHDVSQSINGAIQIAILPGDIAIPTDDKILIVGGFVTPTDSGMIVVHCNAGGTNAAEVRNSTPYNEPAALVVQPDGKILVGDYLSSVVNRFTSDGYLDRGNGTISDPGFGIDDPEHPGFRTGWTDRVNFIDISQIGDNGCLSAMALDPSSGPSSGGILAVGDFGIVKYTRTGQLDPGFGPVHDGIIAYPFSFLDVGYADWSHTVFVAPGLGVPGVPKPFPAGAAYQPDGKILIGGATAGLGRLNADGSPDTSFGTDQTGSISAVVGGEMIGMFLQAGGHVTLLSNDQNAGAMRLVRFEWSPKPDHVVAGQTVTMNFSATDPGSADQAAGFAYQVNWGDGSPTETIPRTAGKGAGFSRTHVYAAPATTVYSIIVTATDKDGGVSNSSINVTVDPQGGSQTIPATVSELQAALDGSLPTDPVSGLPAATFTVTTTQEATDLVSLIQAQPLPVAVVLNGSGVDFTDFHASIPFGVTLVLNGMIYHGGSPALTLLSGNLIITGSTFVNSTNAPTILVAGGRLTLRNDTVQESTGYSQAAIQITGGFVDLGTASDLGHNVININGAGVWIRHTWPNPASTDGDTFLVNGATLTAPLVGAVTAQVDPVRTGLAISASAGFSGTSAAATHSAVWSWGDLTTSAGTVSESYGQGTVMGSHSYASPGVYTVTLTVTDNTGTSSQSVFQYLVIYDPSAGFVTGGGWINSPAGAYTANSSLAGKANFGFESRYQNGNSVPTGNTEFQFKLANFNFKSTAYEWLVVSGAKARFRGTGTVNGAGSYGFELTAWDGQSSGGGGTDRFRIKIWNANQGNGVVYDNQMGAADGADPTTTLGGGSIVIHKQDPLLAAGGPVTRRDASQLTTAALRPIVQAAIDRWAVAGLDASHLRIMRSATFTIGDLGGSYIGLADPDTHAIRIDDDAAGYGWFVDATPRDDSEFRTPGDRRVFGRMDLLSVIAHELGHLVGLDDNHAEGRAADVMGDSLTSAIRRMPTAVDVLPPMVDHVADSFRRRFGRRR